MLNSKIWGSHSASEAPRRRSGEKVESPKGFSRNSSLSLRSVAGPDGPEEGQTI